MLESCDLLTQFKIYRKKQEKEVELGNTLRIGYKLEVGRPHWTSGLCSVCIVSLYLYPISFVAVAVVTWTGAEVIQKGAQ